MAAAKTMYFALKLVAPCVGDRKLQPCAVPGTNPTRHCTDEDNGGGSQFLAIGGKQPANFAGIAGHFTACVLDFNDAEDAACKSVAEAERLVQKKYKAWLADAYDWFVIPSTLGSGAPRAAAKKPAKK